MSECFHLFVYGTLRSTGSAASRMAGCELLGGGSVGGVLYDIEGAYPALIVYGNTPVHGEVWRCPASMLRPLDEYEDVASGWFRRIGVDVQLEDGRTQGCWAYVAGPSLSRKLASARRIEQWG
jgi:gamma-glutamylcyclotransferase (GGCT)/AIG2-like uncharacterized protein YtfP